ncbi:MAG: mannitol dehydrogenase family protein, partial [Eubacteriales bacterium]|nr:mannitol dehydrogenase family protein [Eubacteriales bacterium]
EQLSAARLGMRGPMRAMLRPILGNPALFGADLYGAGLAERVEEDFAAMLAGPGAVRATLRRRLAEKG